MYIPIRETPVDPFVTNVIVKIGQADINSAGSGELGVSVDVHVYVCINVSLIRINRTRG